MECRPEKWLCYSLCDRQIRFDFCICFTPQWAACHGNLDTFIFHRAHCCPRGVFCVQRYGSPAAVHAPLPLAAKCRSAVLNLSDISHPLAFSISHQYWKSRCRCGWRRPWYTLAVSSIHCLGVALSLDTCRRTLCAHGLLVLVSEFRTIHSEWGHLRWIIVGFSWRTHHVAYPGISVAARTEFDTASTPIRGVTSMISCLTNGIVPRQRLTSPPLGDTPSGMRRSLMIAGQRS